MKRSRVWSWQFILGLMLITVGIFINVQYVRLTIQPHTDFLNDYRAAQALLSGNSLYGYTNAHPPFVAFFFVPFTFLPYEMAFVFWILISSLLFLLSIVKMICALSIKINYDSRLMAFGSLLCWYPFIANMALGQLSLFLTACVGGRLGGAT